MRGKYVNMWLICVNMQHRSVDMQHNCVNMWVPGKHIKVVACWHKYAASYMYNNYVEYWHNLYLGAEVYHHRFLVFYKKINFTLLLCKCVSHTNENKRYEKLCPLTDESKAYRKYVTNSHWENIHTRYEVKYNNWNIHSDCGTRDMLNRTSVEGSDDRPSHRSIWGW